MGEASGPGLDEGADEVAHHVVEKAGAGDGVDEEVAVGVPLGVVDGAEIVGGASETRGFFPFSSFRVRMTNGWGGQLASANL